jgi:hypothetical protein
MDCHTSPTCCSTGECPQSPCKNQVESRVAAQGLPRASRVIALPSSTLPPQPRHSVASLGPVFLDVPGTSHRPAQVHRFCRSTVLAPPMFSSRLTAPAVQEAHGLRLWFLPWESEVPHLAANHNFEHAQASRARGGLHPGQSTQYRGLRLVLAVCLGHSDDLATPAPWRRVRRHKLIRTRGSREVSEIGSEC